MCRQKVKKYLGSVRSNRRVDAYLLIYVNFSTLAGAVLSDEEMVKLTKPWKDNFLSIWLHCGARIFRSWPSPLAFSATTDPADQIS